MFVQFIDNNSISNYLKEIIKEFYVVGIVENFKIVEYVEYIFKVYGLDVYYKDYDVLLIYFLY